MAGTRGTSCKKTSRVRSRTTIDFEFAYEFLSDAGGWRTHEQSALVFERLVPGLKIDRKSSRQRLRGPGNSIRTGSSKRRRGRARLEEARGGREGPGESAAGKRKIKTRSDIMDVNNRKTLLWPSFSARQMNRPDSNIHGRHLV